jgi:prophage maintenance system killer protein
MVKMTKKRFFNDGNKKTALIFANALLVLNNFDFIFIESQNKFASLLLGAQNSEKNIDKLIVYLKK